MTRTKREKPAAIARVGALHAPVQKKPAPAAAPAPASGSKKCERERSLLKSQSPRLKAPGKVRSALKSQDPRLKAVVVAASAHAKPAKRKCVTEAEAEAAAAAGSGASAKAKRKTSDKAKAERRAVRSYVRRSLVPRRGIFTVAKTGRRRIAVSIINELSPLQSVLMRPCVTTVAAMAVEGVMAGLVENAHGWNKMHRGKMLMPNQLQRAFADYCGIKGGVWCGVLAEYELVKKAIERGELVQLDAAARAQYAATDEGMMRSQIRSASNAKAKLTKCANQSNTRIAQLRAHEARAQSDIAADQAYLDESPRGSGSDVAAERAPAAKAARIEALGHAIEREDASLREIDGDADQQAPLLERAALAESLRQKRSELAGLLDETESMQLDA
jgi:hypothetical protein